MTGPDCEGFNPARSGMLNPSPASQYDCSNAGRCCGPQLISPTDRFALELSKTFDPKIAEERWYERWVELGYFKADPDRPGPVFSIVIPPPNVTGQLHLGHALNVTLQDIIVRTRRMQGYNTLWVPGTDHAGIATQNVVEREIAKEKTNRHRTRTRGV